MNKYSNWIKNYTGSKFRTCKEVSELMQATFPELRIAKGLVQIIENCKWYQHQWLVNTNGNIIDPTSSQWLGIIEYNEIKESDPKPVCKCMNCGEIIFSDFNFGREICSESCYNSFIN